MSRHPGTIAGPLSVCVTGWSGAGKTTLIARAIAECARRGLVASAVKRARHSPELFGTGKDTSVFLGAGARASVYASDSGSVVFLPPSPEGIPAPYGRILEAADILFWEGAEVGGALRISVVASGAGLEGLKRPLAATDLLVTDDPVCAAAALAAGVPALPPGDAGGFIDFILEADMSGKHADRPGRRVRILCDGHDIPMVPFVETIFSRTIEAMVGTLKGCDPSASISITLEGDRDAPAGDAKA